MSKPDASASKSQSPADSLRKILWKCVASGMDEVAEKAYNSLARMYRDHLDQMQQIYDSLVNLGEDPVSSRKEQLKQKRELQDMARQIEEMRADLAYIIRKGFKGIRQDMIGYLEEDQVVSVEFKRVIGELYYKPRAGTREYDIFLRKLLAGDEDALRLGTPR